MHQTAALGCNKNCFPVPMEDAEATGLMHKIIEPGRPSQANTLQIPIAQAKQTGNICSIPAVSSPEDYPTPAPNVVSIRRPFRVGRHLIILNNCGPFHQ
jgi:hypothetical protein